MKTSIEMIADAVPSVRAEIARELASSHKLSQTEISGMIGVTQPAVSQYLRQIRGKVSFNDDVLLQIRNVCERIINGKIDRDGLETELYNICRLTISKKK